VPPPLATIGYEGATVVGVIGRLKGAGVRLLLDVRAVAASRRPGFSKSALCNALAEAGIDYRHLRALGTPKSGREAARAGRTLEMHRIFEDHLAEPAALVELAEAERLVRAQPAALLCFEADAARCHRRILAGRLREAIGCPVVDL
jgi:uncharacterized protein (DUF488 family)